MDKLKRKLFFTDLEDKGYPFECVNCGQKPIPEDVIQFGGSCEICGDEIIAYTIDTAEFIIKNLSNKIKG